MKKKLMAKLATGLLVFGLAGMASASSVIGVSIPVDSSTGGNWSTADGGVWSSEPLDVNLGIGHIMAPFGTSGYFSLHDHVYISLNVPDPSRAVVTYHFDGSVIVKGLEVEQHGNGITKVEGFAGNSLASLTSIGEASISGWPFEEFSLSTFNFSSNVLDGSYFQFVIRETGLENGYATYAVHPIFDASPVPIPAAIWFFASALAGLIGFGRRKGF